MHIPVQPFVQSVAETFDLQGPIYEFGYWRQHDVAHASSPASDLVDIGYVGPDLHGDTQVDHLEELSTLPYPSESARTVCCVNVLEYTFEPHRAIDEMVRLLTPGGMLLVFASIHESHGTSPGPFWRMTPQGLQRLLHPLDALLVGWQGPDQDPFAAFAIGCKSPVPAAFLPSIRRFLDVFQHRLDQAAVGARRSGWLGRWLWGWARSNTQRQQQLDRYQCRFALHFPFSGKATLQDVLFEGLPPSGNPGSRVDFSF